MLSGLAKNGGLGNALNEGIKHCKNELVARMDSDDIAYPDRCEKQINVFNTHPEVSICSGVVEEFTTDPNTVEYEASAAGDECGNCRVCKEAESVQSPLCDV